MRSGRFDLFSVAAAIGFIHVAMMFTLLATMQETGRSLNSTLGFLCAAAAFLAVADLKVIVAGLRLRLRDLKKAASTKQPSVPPAITN